MTIKKILVIASAAALAAAIYAAWSLYSDNSARKTPVYSGTVEAVEVLPSFQLGGRVFSVNFQEGETVSSGQVLAVLDSSELADMVNRAQAYLEAVSARLEPARAQASYLEQAVRARVDSAGANLEKLEAGLRPQEVESARQAVVEAGARARQARDEALRAERLAATGTVPTARRDEAVRLAEAAEAAHRRAEESLRLAEEGTRGEDLKIARAALAAAQAEKIEVRRARLEVAVAEKQVLLAEADLRLALTRLSYATLISPLDAVVMTRAVQVGETVVPGRPVASLADLSEVQVKIYLEEAMLGRVRLGDPVSVAADSSPDRPVKGRISFISDQAEFTPKSILTREERVKLVYMAKVAVPNTDRSLKPGMPVDVALRKEP